MESVLLDAAGHRRSPATMPGYHQGRALTVINAPQVLNRDGRLIVTVLETVEATAEIWLRRSKPPDANRLTSSPSPAARA